MKNVRIMALVAAILLCAAMAVGCAISEPSSDTADTISAATEARYAQSEVREYEGIMLDPAVGPRDNSITGTQFVDIASYTLEVTGLVGSPMSLTYEDVLSMPAYERLVTLYCVDGWDVTILWEGVSLVDLLEGADMDEAATNVVFTAADGYTTSLSLETIYERNIILAYRSNGIDLPPEMGFPFIVVAQDKYGYKWARWVTQIELTDNADFLG